MSNAPLATLTLETLSAHSAPLGLWDADRPLSWVESQMRRQDAAQDPTDPSPTRRPSGRIRFGD